MRILEVPTLLSGVQEKQLGLAKIRLCQSSPRLARIMLFARARTCTPPPAAAATRPEEDRVRQMRLISSAPAAVGSR